MISVKAYQTNTKIKRQILIPLTLAIAILLGVFAVIFYHYQQEHIIKDVVSKLKSAQDLWAVQIDNDAGMMAAALEVIIRDEQLKAALKAKNRQVLLERTQNLYNQLHSQHQITQFYFTGPDRVNILRVHEPSEYGDKIERITTLRAEKTRKLSCGIELGLLGTFTLRVVAPWYDGEHLLGYVELGEEIEHITQKLRDILGIEIFVLIEKKYLNRKNWEAGMRMLGRKFNWDQYPVLVMTYQTSEFVPKELIRMFSNGQQVFMTIGADIESNGIYYRSAFLPLKDAGGHLVGNMVIMRDITGLVRNTRFTIFLAGAICLLVGGTLFVIFFVYLGRLEQQLKRASDEIHTLAISDQLTGLYNRRGFLTLAKQQFKLSDRTKRRSILLFADLDGMKGINDTLGHDEGDRALIEVASVLKETFRSSDIIARMGGDEFAILAIDPEKIVPEIIINRLQSQIDTHNNQANRKYKLSISVDCSSYDPENPCSIDELMASVDRLMYEQKKNKKSCPV
jgi:diguanylate cyclase (GGDEF)-like protein